MRLTYRLSSALISAVEVVSLAFAFFQPARIRWGCDGICRIMRKCWRKGLARSASLWFARHANRGTATVKWIASKDAMQIAGISVYDADGKPLAITSGLARRVEQNPVLLPEPGAEVSR